MSRAVLALALLGCGSHDDAAAPDAAHVTVTITATVERTRVVTREHMLAAGEMQISGEPLAEAMGRDLVELQPRPRPGRSLLRSADRRCRGSISPGSRPAIESYEYSKQPMNNLAFESGAGTSLAYGPLVNTDGAIGAAATAHLAALVQHFGAGAQHARPVRVRRRARIPANNASGNVNPTGAGRRRRQSARLARHLADRPRVRELRSDDRSDARGRASRARSPPTTIPARCRASP